MKIKNMTAYNRASNIIENDKSLMNEECRKLAQKDFTKTAKEYFDLGSEIEIRVENREGNVWVTLQFKADRIKNFYGLK